MPASVGIQLFAKPTCRWWSITAAFSFCPGCEYPTGQPHPLPGGAATARDWLSAYRVQPVLLETLVDQTRYHGGCYRAANWRQVGLTQGADAWIAAARRKASENTSFYFRSTAIGGNDWCRVAFAPGGCMNLLETFDDLLQGWRPTFAEVRTFARARRLTLGLLVCMRRHLTSQPSAPPAGNSWIGLRIIAYARVACGIRGNSSILFSTVSRRY